MRQRRLTEERIVAILCAGSIAFAAAAAMAQGSASTEGAPSATDELAGLWKAKNRFGPGELGPLILLQVGEGYVADIAGHRIPVREEQAELVLDLPDGAGTFRGKLAGADIRGHWFQPGTPVNGSLTVSPVLLEPDSLKRWRGALPVPQDEFTFFLRLTPPRADGTLGALLRNPEFDYGGQQGVDRLVREGHALKLVGTRRGKERIVGIGSYDPDDDVLTLKFPDRGGSYDFRREGDDSAFYPRGRNPARYSYASPLARADGWPVATLESEGIDRTALERFVQKIIDMPMEAADAPQIHALLVARHGRLVLEEYFHGEHRDKLHGTRSAAKVVTTIIAGAAMQAGAPLGLSSPVYRVMYGGAFPEDLDPRKRTMTLEHLITMSSGFHCDDADDDAPGNEDAMLEQTQERDYYRYTLKVPLVTPPGEKAVYCSCNPNLALGMVGRAMEESPAYTFDRLVGGPLGIAAYAWPADPAGNVYGGGGTAFLPRDFLKFGQLMLDDGVWQRRRILGHEFVRRATTPQYHLARIYYDYTWWSEDFPYKDRTVRAFMALGAGGQAVTVVPELSLVVGTFAGNYNSKGTLDITHHYVPRYILPAVREKGDDMRAPVQDRSYASPYGRSPADGGRVSSDTREGSPSSKVGQ
jgi:CubicO group peptidase (beta-lactamase class C family)